MISILKKNRSLNIKTTSISQSLILIEMLEKGFCEAGLGSRVHKAMKTLAKNNPCFFEVETYIPIKVAVIARIKFTNNLLELGTFSFQKNDNNENKGGIIK